MPTSGLHAFPILVEEAKPFGRTQAQARKGVDACKPTGRARRRLVGNTVWGDKALSFVFPSNIDLYDVLDDDDDDDDYDHRAHPHNHTPDTDSGQGAHVKRAGKA